jgi:phosphate transport system substrate-binding protein
MDALLCREASFRKTCEAAFLPETEDFRRQTLRKCHMKKLFKGFWPIGAVVLLAAGTAALATAEIGQAWAADITGSKPAAAVSVDPSIPKYQAVKGISGTIKSAGSDTMVNLMTIWTEGFRKMYPAVQPSIEGKGSGTAMPALIEGTVDFGPMSREVNGEEIAAFEKKFGYKPTQLPTAVDMVGVFVHKDNPIEGLNLQQLDAIFSETRKRGYKSEIRTWGDLGLTGEWANKPISLYGRNAASGTYTYFKEHVLKKGDFKNSVKEQPGSSAVIGGVAEDKYAIGYSGIGYKTADVRTVSLSDKSAEFVGAEVQNAYSGKYPLSRFLLLSVNYKPGSQLDPLKREFIKYVFSYEGQQDVIKGGFFPVPVKIRDKALTSVGLGK